MGKYISIRGWFECEEHDVSKVKEICMEFTENCSDTELNYKQYVQYEYYKPHIYKINVNKINLDRKSKVFENITINY